jgi:hypothetical protein
MSDDLEDRVRRLLSACAAQVQPELSGPALRERAGRRHRSTVIAPLLIAAAVVAIALISLALVTRGHRPNAPAHPGLITGSPIRPSLSTAPASSIPTRARSSAASTPSPSSTAPASASSSPPLTGLLTPAGPTPTPTPTTATRPAAPGVESPSTSATLPPRAERSTAPAPPRAATTGAVVQQNAGRPRV